MPRPDGLVVRPFTPDAIEDAGRLLAARHRIQRLTEPGLSPAYEDAAAAQAEVAAIAAIEGASGAVAHRGDEFVGYLLGSPRAPMWGPNRWVEGAGHAVAEPETVRDLYGFAASRWVEDGATSHYAIVPATDPALVDAWFRVGFGQQHVHAIREVPDAGASFEVPPGLAVRLAERRDIPAMGRIDVSLPEHQARSPVFSMQTPHTVEAAVADIDADFDDPDVHDVRRRARRGRGRLRGRLRGRAVVRAPRHRPAGSGRVPRVRGRAAGGPRPRRGAAPRRGGPRLVARRGLPDGRHRLARDQPALEPDVAAARLPPDVPAPVPRDRLSGARRRCREREPRMGQALAVLFAAAAARAPSQSFLNWTMPLSVSG